MSGEQLVLLVGQSSVALGAIHQWKGLMFTGVEGTRCVVVQEVLLKLLSIGFSGWVW